MQLLILFYSMHNIAKYLVANKVIVDAGGEQGSHSLGVGETVDPFGT
jgi:hypothetical protein